MKINFKFKNIHLSSYYAKVAKVNTTDTKFGPCIKITFTVTEGELTDYQFSALVDPIPIKGFKFHRWISNILGYEPDDEFSTDSIIGKDCIIQLSKRNNYFNVCGVFSINDMNEPPF